MGGAVQPREPLERALEDALGEPASVVLAWRDVRDATGPRDIVVYAFPSRRLATLRHWIDEREFTHEGRAVVAFEAAKWARLMLKGHGGALRTARAAPAIDAPPGLPPLPALAAALWSDATNDWCRRAGLPERPVGTLNTGGARFDAVECWLAAVRAHADA